MSDVTQILEAIQRGESHAADELLPLVYQALRQLAAQRLALEPSGQTLQPTALVHEAYVRLIDLDQPPEWESRAHFFAAAAQGMRRILVENARRKRSLKRGAYLRRTNVPIDQVEGLHRDEDLLALDEALDKLEAKDPRAAKLVQLRYFAGLTMAQAAKTINVSLATAKRDWSYARAWLHRSIAGGTSPD